MTILHRAVALPARLVDEENALLTLALATIVVLTVASLALMLWPEAPAPAPPDPDAPDAEDRVASGADDDHDRPAG